MNFLYWLFSFIFGLAIGSFLNCLIWRLHIKKSILGRSVCPDCGHQIAWYDNIPLLSFIFLKGRCRYCHQKISWQYPMVELATGLLFVFSFLILDSSLHILDSIFYLSLFRYWIISAVLIFTFVYDFKYLEIEDIVLLPSAGIIFVLDLLLGYSAIKILLAVFIAVLFFLLQYWITKGKGVGLGDYRIGIFMGMALGNWSQLAVAIFISYIVGTLVSLILLIGKKKGMKSMIPLGPFLAIGTFTALFYGRQIINWYLQSI
ncbi:MAG: prepilin peptidase [Patescibacteria group bacterium]|nr:prepilin peptidase [Patescibacteria group bacterium]